jgi:5-methylcytosine-specific restriction endonuclease McrA
MRGNSGERGYDAAWQKLRKLKIVRYPLCEEHLKHGRAVPAQKVHHIKPIETHPHLMLVMENLMSLCNECHEKVHGPERWQGRGNSSRMTGA